MAEMRRRRLGRSPVEVTELSLGGAPLGNLFGEVSEEAARSAVDAAWGGGIRAFDTAPHYGLGLSERRLGAALRDRPRAQYAVSTKVGRVLEPVAPPYRTDTAGFAVRADHRRVFDFTADGVNRSLSDSLTRLGLDYVDIVLIHDPDSHGEQALREAYPALETLRAEGCVRAIGVGMNQAAMLSQFVRATDIDVVLVAGRFTLLDQSAAADLLPAALEKGVAVLAGGVFNSGLLAAPVVGASYDYAAASAELIGRARELESICARYGIPLRAAAARFPLCHPAVTSVLIGARSAAEVNDALKLADMQIPAQVWDAMGLGDFQ